MRPITEVLQDLFSWNRKRTYYSTAPEHLDEDRMGRKIPFTVPLDLYLLDKLLLLLNLLLIILTFPFFIITGIAQSLSDLIHDTQWTLDKQLQKRRKQNVTNP